MNKTETRLNHLSVSASMFEGLSFVVTRWLLAIWTRRICCSYIYQTIDSAKSLLEVYDATVDKVLGDLAVAQSVNLL